MHRLLTSETLKLVHFACNLTDLFKQSRKNKRTLMARSFLGHCFAHTQNKKSLEPLILLRVELHVDGRSNG